ncbi:GldG family protein [Leptospira ilyithenensis]|uniref:Uncharacterized protein n=1 Tax=Leptospira ilyithenensis TaxID=2484901 RepID=A0A4R9LJE7_9LEPT|nr:GldG family protein [Leptospira ilyithenensis]TGN06953.1 hypothetical protein EHS11_17640 [Leptospira ilyithenensis]
MRIQILHRWKRSGKFLVFQVILFFVLSNVLLDRFVIRIDISASSRLSFSEYTESVLRSINKPLVIDAYYSSDLPSEYQVRLDVIQEYLMELSKRNSSQIKLNFYDPDSSPEAKQKVKDSGLIPNEIRKAGVSSPLFYEAYMGIVIHYDGESEVVPDFFFVEEAESQFVRAIRRIEERKLGQRIAVIADPGCFYYPKPGEGSGKDTWGVFFHQALVKEYGYPKEISLNKQKIGDTIKLILVVGAPQWSIQGKRNLEEYLLRGGRAIFLLGSMEFRLNPVRGAKGLSFEKATPAIPNANNSFWTDILSHYGFQLETNLVLDFQHPVHLAEQKGGSLPGYYPFWQVITKHDGDIHLGNEISNLTDVLLVPWVSSFSMDISKQRTMKYETLLWSGEKISLVPNLVPVNGVNLASKGIPAKSRVPIAVLLEGRLNPFFKENLEKKKELTKIMLFSTPYFVSDILALPEFRIYLRDANVPFMLNAIDFFLEDRNHSSVRKQNLAVLPLRAFSIYERNLYSAFNTFFIPMALFLYALRRIKKRQSARE